MNAYNHELKNTPPLTYDQCPPGRLVRNIHYSAFKVQIVLGHLASGVRVCTWSANQGCWSKPLTAKLEALRLIKDDELSSRQATVVKAALADAARGNCVKFAGGSRPVPPPFVHQNKPSASHDHQIVLALRVYDDRGELEPRTLEVARECLERAAYEWTARVAKIAADYLKQPRCARTMGCLCAGHARGLGADQKCDTSEGANEQSMQTQEALELALYLAITAPTDAKAAQCTVQAEKIAAGMDPADVERAKVAALARARKSQVVVTKLAPVHGKARKGKPLVITDEAKTKAQKLNAKLSGWMFGKDKP
jgi:hypothetical protein